MLTSGIADDGKAIPLLLIAGAGHLAERVHAELTRAAGHTVDVVAPETLRAGIDDGLRAAGIMEASSLLVLSDDDGFNLQVGLRARTLNRDVRVVLRVFDAVLGRKIEQNLPNSAVLSMTAHSAATYAAAALDTNSFFALRFPEQQGPIVAFREAPAADLGIAGRSVGDGEGRLGIRIIALNERVYPSAGALVTGSDRVAYFGVLRAHPPSESTAEGRHRDDAPRSAPSVRSIVAALSRMSPVLRTFIVVATLFFSGSYLYFHFVLRKSAVAAAFSVTETMTNVGFGETAVTQRGALVTAGAIVAMLGGIVFTSIFIGYVSSALTRAEWTVTQGLRRIRGHGHVIVCGAGRIGGAVVGILTRAGRRVVVIDPEPGAWLVRRARDRDVDLLTGSATRDDALQLANVHGAAAVLALTDNDTVNLEIALSARAIAPSIPLVVRMEDATFAATTADVFGIQTFSPAALSAPAFAGLARFPGTRGRVRFASEDHTIGQRTQGVVPLPPPVNGSMPLAVWRAGSLRLIREYDQMAPHDVLLFTVALGQHHAVPTTVAGGYAP